MKSDEALVLAAQQGDTAAYGELVTRLQDRLYSAMIQILGKHEEAEEVVQDSFVQAFVKLDSFRGSSQFYTWLYRIAFNNALAKKRRRRNQLSLDAGRELLGNDPQDFSSPPDGPMMQQESIRLVQVALDLLTDEHREILVLREMQDKSYEEIAECLSINIGTVRSRLSRARLQLKAQIEMMEGVD